MKKTFCMILISVILALSMTACGGDKDKGTDSQAAESTQTLESGGDAAESSGTREMPVPIEEEEEPVELDELDELEELPEEYEPAGEGPEDAEWNN